MEENTITTTRQQYWNQTGKLALAGLIIITATLVVAFGYGFYLGVTGGEESESVFNAVDIIGGIAFIVAAIRLYEGFGFWRGLGGFILIKILLSFIIAMALMAGNLA